MNVSNSYNASVQRTQQPTQLQQSEQKNEVTAGAKETEKQRVEQSNNKPVINTQGQTTGRLVNVTA